MSKLCTKTVGFLIFLPLFLNLIQVSSCSDSFLGDYNLSVGDTFIWRVYGDSDIDYLHKFKVTGMDDSNQLIGDTDQYSLIQNNSECHSFCLTELIKNKTSVSSYLTSVGKIQNRTIAQKSIAYIEINQGEVRTLIDIQTGVLIEKSMPHFSITLISWDDSELSQIAKKLDNQDILNFIATLAVGVLGTSVIYLWWVHSDKRKQAKWNISYP